MPFNKKNISQILKYLNNELSDKERYAFEREMEADPFLMDAVEGYEKGDTTEIFDTLSNLGNHFTNNKRKNKIPIWIKIAAITIFITGISSLLFISNNKTQKTLLSKQQNIPVSKLDSTPPSLSQEVQWLQKQDNEITNNPEEFEPIDNKSPKTFEKQEKQPISKIERSSAKQILIVEDDIEISDTDFITDEELELDYITQNEKNIITGKLEGDKIKLSNSSLATNKIIEQSLSKDSFIQYKGKVIDQNGSPIPGATIIEAGQPNGTITDTKGNFTLKTSKTESMLTIDFIGYKQKSLIVKNDSIGEITLENDIMAMDEVVTIGYGTKKSANRNSTSKGLTLKNNLIPYPLIGYKKFKRKVEHNLTLPENSLKNKIHVNIFITDSGEISNIKIITPVDDNFANDLTMEIKRLGLWQPAVINNKSTNGSRLVIFEF